MSVYSHNYNKIHKMEIEAGRHCADSYDDAYETLFYEATRKMVAETAIRNDRETLRVLDMGCGTGALTKFLSGRPNCSTVAVDISTEMLSVAKGKQFKDVEFVSTAIEWLPFKDNSFDVVVGYSVLHHLPDLVKLFDEIFRVLRPSGHFIFGEPAESFLDRHKNLFRALKFPFYPLYLFLKKKNSKDLKIFKHIDFDAFSTSVHRHLSEKEIVDCIEKGDRKISFQVKRMGVLSPWLGSVLFKSKQMDQLIFKPLWYVDLALSRTLLKCTSEIFIKGTVNK